jgi:hypothetical protein
MWCMPEPEFMAIFHVVFSQHPPRSAVVSDKVLNNLGYKYFLDSLEY